MTKDNFISLYDNYINDYNNTGYSLSLSDVNSCSITDFVKFNSEKEEEDFKDYMYSCIGKHFGFPKEITDIEDFKEKEIAKTKYLESKYKEYDYILCHCPAHGDFKEFVRHEDRYEYFVPCPKCLQQQLAQVDYYRLKKQRYLITQNNNIN